MANGFVQEPTENVAATTSTTADVGAATQTTQTTPTVTPTFDPGFVQTPTTTTAQPTQTFGTSVTPTTQTFTPSDVPTISDTSSLAPTLPGRTIGDSTTSIGLRQRSDSDFGGIAAGAAGAGGLAALLGALGREDTGGGGLLSPENILSGAKKIFDLGNQSGTSPFTKLKELLPEDLQSLVDNISEAPSKIIDNLFGGGDPVSNVGSTATSPSSLGHTGEGLYGTGTSPVGDPFSAAKEVANLVGPISQGAASYAAATASLFPGAAASTSALMSAPGMASTMTAAGTTLVPSVGGTIAGVMGPSAMIPTAAHLAAAPASVAGGLASTTGLAAAAGPLAIAAIGFGILKGMKKDDPTINKRMAAELGRHAEAAMNGDAGALASIKARLFGDSAAGGEHPGELIKLAVSGEPQITSGWQGSIPYGHKDEANYPHHVVQWKPEVQKWYRENVLGEHKIIHSTRDKIVGGRSAEDPLQLNPYIDTTTSRVVPPQQAGADGPVNIYMAAKINESRGGMTPSEANTFYARTGQMPAGFVDWRNNPNSQFYVDPSNQGG